MLTGRTKSARLSDRTFFYGVDLIKLVADSSRSYYSVEEIRTAVEVAHSAGLAVCSTRRGERAS